MRHLYSALTYLLTPVLLVYFLVRGTSDRRWLHRWPQRFGRFDAGGRAGGIVVHAASVGEVNAAAPLVERLLSLRPDLPLTLSCFTPTGAARGRALFGDRVFHLHAPIDTPGAVRRFFRALVPKLLIVMETEIWPNLFRRANRLGVPLLVSNARLTERSERGWARFGGLAGDTLRRTSMIAAQSPQDRDRFIALGADRDRTRDVGNLKFDITLPEEVAQAGHEWRERWGSHRIALVAGSTHAIDEAALVASFGQVLVRHRDALLVLAPRYPERFEEAHQFAREAGLAVARWSERADEITAQCLVIDRMGELLGLYAAADIAFIGGTLAPVGGHNPLEAAALGCALILGPHTANIDGLARSLRDCGAAWQVEDAAALQQAWASLLEDPGRRRAMGTAARELVERERGALDRTLEIIERLLLE